MCRIETGRKSSARVSTAAGLGTKTESIVGHRTIAVHTNPGHSSSAEQFARFDTQRRNLTS